MIVFCPRMIKVVMNNKYDWVWENPPYGIRTQFAQCAFLVPQVNRICMSKNNSYRRLQRLSVTYQGEISLSIQAPREITVKRRCYAHVQHFRILRVYRKSINRPRQSH